MKTIADDKPRSCLVGRHWPAPLETNACPGNQNFHFFLWVEVSRQITLFAGPCLTMKVRKNKGKMGESKQEIVKEKNGYYYNKMHIITFMEKENFM